MVQVVKLILTHSSYQVPKPDDEEIYPIKLSNNNNIIYVFELLNILMIRSRCPWEIGFKSKRELRRDIFFPLKVIELTLTSKGIYLTESAELFKH